MPGDGVANAQLEVGSEGCADAALDVLRGYLGDAAQELQRARCDEVAAGSVSIAFTGVVPGGCHADSLRESGVSPG